MTKNPDGMSMYALSQIQYTQQSGKLGGAPSEQALQLSHEMSNQSMDLDRSIQEINLSQQVSVSFQAIEKPTSASFAAQNGQSKKALRNRN